MLRVILGTRGTSGVLEFGGSAWVRLQYMLGFRRLGVDVTWVDRLHLVDPYEQLRSVEFMADRFARFAEQFGFRNNYCIEYDGGRQLFGMSRENYETNVKEADLLINISGHMPSDSILLNIPRRAFIDVDPGFTQIWAELGSDMCFSKHTHFFTIGQTFGTPVYTGPMAGIEWNVMAPPVVLDEWPVRSDRGCSCYTTVADWASSQQAIWDGEYYAGKRSEFLKCIRLPQDTKLIFAPALTIPYSDFADIQELWNNGWAVLEAYRYAGDAATYREFIQWSRGEFSVAKNGYVKCNSGWISDRTVCYLASGKPAVVQSTGFESVLECGKGLVTFRTYEDAVAAMKEVDNNYEAHCRAARVLAERYFDSDIVLGGLLRKCGL
jgi:hypothetical protein